MSQNKSCQMTESTSAYCNLTSNIVCQHQCHYNFEERQDSLSEMGQFNLSKYFSRVSLFYHDHHICEKNWQTAASIFNFIYPEKATKICEIFTLLLSYVLPVKRKLKISQNFVVFSEYVYEL